MITLQPPDPDWPRAAAAEIRRLRVTLGAEALALAHVGSTAVPGLEAKPVIDLQVSVATVIPVARWIDRLAPLGYVHLPLGDFDRVYPFFHRPAAWPSTHHLHLCVAGSSQEREHLAFRDALRADAALCRAYERLKRGLAARHVGDDWPSREAYSLGKSAFVRAVLVGDRSAALATADALRPATGEASD